MCLHWTKLGVYTTWGQSKHMRLYMVHVWTLLGTCMRCHSSKLEKLNYMVWQQHN